MLEKMNVFHLIYMMHMCIKHYMVNPISMYNF